MPEASEFTPVTPSPRASVDAQSLPRQQRDPAGAVGLPRVGRRRDFEQLQPSRDSTSSRAWWMWTKAKKQRQLAGHGHLLIRLHTLASPSSSRRLRKRSPRHAAPRYRRLAHGTRRDPAWAGVAVRRSARTPATAPVGDVVEVAQVRGRSEDDPWADAKVSLFARRVEHTLREVHRQHGQAVGGQRTRITSPAPHPASRTGTSSPRYSLERGVVAGAARRLQQGIALGVLRQANQRTAPCARSSARGSGRCAPAVVARHLIVRSPMVIFDGLGEARRPQLGRGIGRLVRRGRSRRFMGDGVLSRQAGEVASDVRRCASICGPLRACCYTIASTTPIVPATRVRSAYAIPIVAGGGAADLWLLDRVRGGRAARRARACRSPARRRWWPARSTQA